MIDTIKKHLKYLFPTDVVVIGFYFVLNLVNIIFHDKIEFYSIFIFFNLLTITAIFFLAKLDAEGNSQIIKQIHNWYMVILIFLTFKELYYIIRPIHNFQDYDNWLIAADRFLFGVDPTHLMYKISNPLLTEILQISYHLFYFHPIILGIWLLNNKKILEFNFALFCIVYGFFLSYLGYLTLPAIGPRFTLHDFNSINMELPGIWLTQFLRDWVNWGESLMPNTPNPAEVIQRDVFPSGHTQMTLIAMYLSVKLKSASKYFILPTGTLLIFSTVYLRYHYVIDLIAGLFFMIFTMITGYYLYNYWQKLTNKELFRFK